MISVEKEAPTHNPGTGPHPKNLPFSNALGVGNHCNKTEPDALSPVPPGFLPVCKHPSSLHLGQEPSIDNASYSPASLRPRSRFPGHPARRRCGSVPPWPPVAGAQPSLPPPRSAARQRSCELCTARRGYSRSFRYTISPQLPHPCPA